MKTIGISFLLCALLALYGCGASFTCPAPNSGMKCTSVSTVYSRALSGELEASPQKTSVEEFNPDDIKEKKPATVSAKLETSKMVPLRTPPKIIRMWIAPWEDDDGDLNQGGYVFSEITDPKNRWVIGEKSPKQGGIKDSVKFFSGKMPSKQREGAIERDRLSRDTQQADKQTTPKKQQVQPAQQPPAPSIARKPVAAQPAKPVLKETEGVDEACKGSACQINERSAGQK